MLHCISHTQDEDEGEGAGQEDLEDDVTAVGGDILGVGPTLGLVGDDPTSNLGPLGHDMTAALLAPQGESARAGCQVGAPGQDKWAAQTGQCSSDEIACRRLLWRGYLAWCCVLGMVTCWRGHAAFLPEASLHISCFARAVPQHRM
jgi:hypothetical protein